jgi:hypothetical protein
MHPEGTTAPGEPGRPGRPALVRTVLAVQCVGNGKAPEGREVTTADIKSAAARLEEEDDSWATQPVGKSNMQEVAPMITELVKLLNEAANAAERLQKTSASAWMLASGSALLKHIRDAKEHVSASKPAGLCSNCEGEGCSKCFETGWVNRTSFEMTRKK